MAYEGEYETVEDIEEEESDVEEDDEEDEVAPRKRREKKWKVSLGEGDGDSRGNLNDQASTFVNISRYVLSAGSQQTQESNVGLLPFLAGRAPQCQG
jgi:hypothetical protein